MIIIQAEVNQFYCLPRLYALQKGHIFIDGQDIALGSAIRCSAIALVPQDPILFHRTRAKIFYAKPDALMKTAAAKALY